MKEDEKIRQAILDEQSHTAERPAAPDISTLPQNLILPERQFVELRAGDLCPKCHRAHLDYDGLLNLACPACGYALGGCFTW